MNLIAHLLKKDIRRSRGLLFAWVLLLILQGVLVSSSANPGDAIIQSVYLMISTVVPLFKALLLIVIVPFVVQDDPLVGTTAFWLTRPISRSTLLRAKTLYAAAVLVLPALAVEVIVFAANGITAHEIALAVPEILLGQIELIMVIAVLAALTPSFGKYAIVGAGAVIAWWVAALAIQWSGMYLHPDHFLAHAMDFSMAYSISVVTGVLAIFFCVAVVAHQYLRRRTRDSFAVACAAVIVILAVRSLWTWDFLSHPVPKSGSAPFDLSAVTLTLGPDVSVRDAMEMRTQSIARKEIWANIYTLGLPSMYSVRMKDIRPHLKLPDGSKLEVEESPNVQLNIQGSVAQLAGDPNSGALVAGLGGTPVANLEKAAENTALYVTLFVVDSETYGKHSDQPLNFSADIDFVASKYQITAEMPLAKGARFDQGSEHTVITEVLHEPTGVDVILRERKTNLLFDRANDANDLNSVMQGLFSGSRHVYVLRNKERNEAVVQKHDNLNFPFDQLFGRSRLVNQAVRLSFGPEPNSGLTTPELTPEWLAGAELVRLDLESVFEFSKPLVVEGFKMNRPKAAGGGDK